MHTDRQDSRHSRARWDIILGVLFVMSFLGVTLVLAMSDVIASPEANEITLTKMSDHEFLK